MVDHEKVSNEALEALRASCELLLYPKPKGQPEAEGELDLDRLPSGLLPQLREYLREHDEDLAKVTKKTLLDNLVVLASHDEKFFQSLQYTMSKNGLPIIGFYDEIDTYFEAEAVARRARDGEHTLDRSSMAGDIMRSGDPDKLDLGLIVNNPALGPEFAREASNLLAARTKMGSADDVEGRVYGPPEPSEGDRVLSRMDAVHNSDFIRRLTSGDKSAYTSSIVQGGTHGERVEQTDITIGPVTR